MNTKNLIIPLLISSLVSSCASFPQNYTKPVGRKDVLATARDSWSDTPALSYMPSRAGMLQAKKQNPLPESVGDRKLSLSFKAGPGTTLEDVLYSLRAQGLNIVSKLKESKAAEVLMPRFDGTVFEFLEYISQVHDVTYEYKNGVIWIAEATRYSVTLPQNKILIEQVSKAIEALGAFDTRADLSAGVIYFYAKRDKADIIENYLDTIAKNAAMVNLQLAVITVRLTRDMNIGLDWTKVAAARGSKDFSPSAGSTSSGTSTATPTTGTAGGTAGAAAGAVAGAAASTVAATAAQVGELLSFTGGQGYAYKFVNDTFSLSAAVNALSTYGLAKTEQNVNLGTLSGLPVKITSGNEIPYVKNVGASTGAGGSVTGTSTTDIVKSGLTVDVTPFYDASDNAIVTTVKVDMSSLVGFRTLSAGANLGTLSQPEMQKLSFENVGRLTAGETIVIGGITYDQYNQNYTSLPGMEKMPVGSQSDMTNRFAIYIVIRPSIVMFAGTAPDATRSDSKMVAAAEAARPAPVLDFAMMAEKPVKVAEPPLPEAGPSEQPSPTPARKKKAKARRPLTNNPVPPSTPAAALMKGLPMPELPPGVAIPGMPMMPPMPTAPVPQNKVPAPQGKGAAPSSPTTPHTLKPTDVAPKGAGVSTGASSFAAVQPGAPYPEDSFPSLKAEYTLASFTHKSPVKKSLMEKVEVAYAR